MAVAPFLGTGARSTRLSGALRMHRSASINRKVALPFRQAFGMVHTVPWPLAPLDSRKPGWAAESRQEGSWCDLFLVRLVLSLGCSVLSDVLEA